MEEKAMEVEGGGEEQMNEGTTATDCA